MASTSWVLTISRQPEIRDPRHATPISRYRAHPSSADQAPHPRRNTASPAGPPALVRGRATTPTLAFEARPVLHLGQRNHAATNAGRDRGPLFRALDANLPNRVSTGAGARARRTQAVGRARLLLARAFVAHWRANHSKAFRG